MISREDEFRSIIRASYTRAELVRLHELASWLAIRSLKNINPGRYENG